MPSRVLEAGMTFLFVELPRPGVLVDGVVLIQAIDQVVYAPAMPYAPPSRSYSDSPSPVVAVSGFVSAESGSLTTRIYV